MSGLKVKLTALGKDYSTLHTVPIIQNPESFLLLFFFFWDESNMLLLEGDMYLEKWRKTENNIGRLSPNMPS